MINSQEKIKILQQAINKDDSQTIFKTSKQLLKEAPNDIEYQQCYAISGIKLKQFDELSVSLFKEEPHANQLKSIYFYYLYSSQQYTKCIQILETRKMSTDLRLLLAQCYFNNLEYAKSIKILYQLMKEQKLSQQQRQTYIIDILAGSSSLSVENQYVKQFNYSISEHSCKQVFYNYSLALYNIGDHEAATKYLNMFESALTKEKQDQIDWVTVKLFRDYMQMDAQQLQADRKWEQKIDEYSTMLKNDRDLNTKSVLLNNLLFLKNIYGKQDYSYKTLEEVMDPLKNKLSEDQRFKLKMNKIGLLLRKNKILEALKLIAEVQSLGSKQYLYSNFQFLRNKYYGLKKMKQYSAIQQLIKQITPIDSNLAFCFAADIAKQRGDHNEILSGLQDSTKWKNQTLKNYIFSLLIKDEAMFDKYSDYLEQLAAKSNEVKILQILLKLYENKLDVVKQKSILNKILSINPKNVHTKVKLAEIYLHQGQAEKAEKMLKGIQMPQEITDLTYLQYIQKNIHISKKEEVKEGDDDLKKQVHRKRIKKTRKPKLPKNIDKYIENYKGDSERWLPKWQRKGYKKKGRKGGKTQGMVTVGKEEKNTYTTGASTSAKEVTKDNNKRRR